jgi:hypothetical protein
VSDSASSISVGPSVAKKPTPQLPSTPTPAPKPSTHHTANADDHVVTLMIKMPKDATVTTHGTGDGFSASIRELKSESKPTKKPTA